MIPAHFTPVMRLPANEHGRDFAVTDIHGTYDLLYKVLDQAGFDPKVDRLVVSGDLVDRGAYSAHVLDFLLKPCVYSVRGNHEHMALEAFDAQGNWQLPQRLLPWMRGNGMGWWLELTAEQRRPLLAALSTLPLVLEVPTSRGLVGFLHADVSAGLTWQEFTAAIQALDPDVVHTCLWGRERIESEVMTGVAGVGRIFVGHTPQWKGIRKFGNVYALDTGAAYGQGAGQGGAALTLANLVAATNVLTAPRKPVGLLNLVDDPSPPEVPFGQGPGYIGVSPAPSNWWVKAFPPRLS